MRVVFGHICIAGACGALRPVVFVGCILCYQAGCTFRIVCVLYLHLFLQFRCGILRPCALEARRSELSPPTHHPPDPSEDLQKARPVEDLGVVLGAMGAALRT